MVQGLQICATGPTEALLNLMKKLGQALNSCRMNRGLTLKEYSFDTHPQMIT